MIKSESLSKLAPALVKAQRQMSNATKDAKNPFFKSKYADLNSVREAVTPALHEQGISVLQLNLHENGKNFVRTTLLHESGEFLCSDTEIVVKEAGNPQALGSAISTLDGTGFLACSLSERRMTTLKVLLAALSHRQHPNLLIRLFRRPPLRNKKLLTPQVALGRNNV